MASNHESKKTRNSSTEQGGSGSTTVRVQARQSVNRTRESAASISAVVPVEAISTSAQWDQDGDDGLAAALRVFFLSHTLDPLTGEIHTIH